MSTRFPTLSSLFSGIVQLSGSDALTGSKAGAVTVLSSSGGSVTINMSMGNNFEITLTENTVFQTPTNYTVGQGGMIFIRQNSSAAKTLGISSWWKAAGSASVTLVTATTGAFDMMAYYIPTGSFALFQMSNDIK